MDSVVDKVHKIQKYVQPDVVEPDVQPKEHDVSKTGSTENIQQKHDIVRDVEHIMDLQKFVSSPSQLKRAIGLNLEGEIKLEPEDEDQLEFTDEEVKAKKKIMFHNNVFALSTVLAKRCRKEKDVNVFEETLYSLDWTFVRGVCRDIESFFNCIVMMLQDYQNSAQLHMDITLHIAEEARSCYLVSFYDFV